MVFAPKCASRTSTRAPLLAALFAMLWGCGTQVSPEQNGSQNGSTVVPLHAPVAPEQRRVSEEPAPFAAAEPVATSPRQKAELAASAELPRYNAAADLERAWLIAEGPDRRALGGRRLVTLTFDDGPGPRTTDAVLKVLRAHRVKAAFFMVASYFDGPSQRAAKICEAARHVAAEGHIVGNHSMHHRKLSDVRDVDARAEIDAASARIEQVTGHKPQLFRPPFGVLGANGQAVVASAGLELTMWTVEARDMTRSDPDSMLRDLIWQLEYSRGGVVLLHDVKWATVKVVDRLLSFLESAKYDPARPERAGYEVVDLPTYMRITAEHPQPFATRYALGQARAAAAELRKAAKAPTQLARAKFPN